MIKINSIIKYLIFFLCLIICSSCENNVEPEAESFVGFWKAEQIFQHFWLDENIDSLSGFGQIAVIDNSGFIEWIQVDVGGTFTGSSVALDISYTGSQSTFTGTAVSKSKLEGIWIAEGDTFTVTYNKRTRN